MEHQYRMMAEIGSREGDPITPDQAKEARESSIHPKMIETVNEILSEKFKGSRVTILQKDIIARFMKKGTGISRKELFEKGHLDFEPVFRKAGWVVSYDKPGYCESYEASFEFSKAK